MRLIPSLQSLALALVLLAAAPVAAADFQYGTYRIQAVGSQWDLRLDASGRFSLSRGGQMAVEGTFKVEGGLVALTDSGGPLAEQANRTGTYGWRITGGQLFFTLVDDRASGRPKVLTAGPWTLQR